MLIYDRIYMMVHKNKEEIESKASEIPTVNLGEVYLFPEEMERDVLPIRAIDEIMVMLRAQLDARGIDYQSVVFIGENDYLEAAAALQTLDENSDYILFDEGEDVLDEDEDGEEHDEAEAFELHLRKLAKAVAKERHQRQFGQLPENTPDLFELTDSEDRSVAVAYLSQIGTLTDSKFIADEELIALEIALNGSGKIYAFDFSKLRLDEHTSLVAYRNMEELDEAAFFTFEVSIANVLTQMADHEIADYYDLTDDKLFELQAKVNEANAKRRSKDPIERVRYQVLFTQYTSQLDEQREVHKGIETYMRSTKAGLVEVEPDHDR